MQILIFLGLLVLSCWQFAVWFNKRQQAEKMVAMKLVSIKHDHKHAQHKQAQQMGGHHGR